MNEKSLICISCPVGCHLKVSRNPAGDGYTVSGNQCPRGAAYAINEMTDPRRTVTATVAAASAAMPRIPVRTDRPLPRKLIDNLLNQLYQVTVTPPVKRGDVLIDNVENTGVKVIFSSDCPQD